MNTLLKWDAVPGASHYIIAYRSSLEIYDVSARKLLSDTTQTALNQLDGVYPPGTQIFLEVAVCDEAHIPIGYFSIEVSFSLPFPAPINLQFA